MKGGVVTGRHWDHEVDVLVIGSGAGGLTAAIVASDAHAKVLVIEKGAMFGGTSALSGGILWIPNSHLANEGGHGEGPQEAFTYMKTLSGGDVSDERIRSYLRHAPEMLRYMSEHTEVRYNSIPYPDYHADDPHGKDGWRTHEPQTLHGRVLGDALYQLPEPHRSNRLFGRFVWSSTEVAKLLTRTPGWITAMAGVLWRHYSDIPHRFRSSRSRFLTGGNALMAMLKVSLYKRQVPLWLETKLIELLAEGGRVVGALVERNGEKMTIRAHNAVILAAGGFERNGELRRQFLSGSTNPEWTASQSNNTGDALTAARAVGADVERMDSAWWAPVIKVPGTDGAHPLFVERALPGAIIVNQAGQRYMNEAASYHMAGLAMIQNNKPDAATIPSYILFDAVFHWRYPMGPLLPMLPDFLLPKALRGILVKAASLTELAQKLNMQPAALIATIERFNAQARLGKDLDFGRGEQIYDRVFGDRKISPNPNLAPLSKPPYFALPIYPGDIGTNGGLRTDENARVQNSQGRSIDGLYAIGNVAASVMGRSYPGGGATLGPAMTYGYLAARDAMKGTAQPNATARPKVTAQPNATAQPKDTAQPKVT
jgi:3-oxosteroid 1-dehydrogenase